MDDAKKQLVDKLKTASNILVTVSRDPSVDQLASCLGLALLLNKAGKHTAAVFSGQVPSTLEFLQPEHTLEKNTDSLRDFIIALDKSKADKLRYKVEDNVVRIFITPYKTSIGQEDLEFSQGDFNVDVVVALGVAKQEDLDEAIVAHGRILHDATVASINIGTESQLGSINWYDPKASSLSELVTELGRSIDSTLLDNQIATALLTGIVSATERFRNDKTTSQTMTASATLMAAGANQQLVASKLEETAKPAENQSEEPQPEAADEAKATPANDDGAIEIEHDNQEPPDEAIELPAPSEEATPPEPAIETSAAEAAPPAEPASDPNSTLSSGPKFITEPPMLGGTLTANSQLPGLDPVTDPFSMPQSESPQLLEHDAEPADTLSDIEREVKESEQQANEEATGLNSARSEVDRALNTAESTLPPKPIQALNAQPLVDLHSDLSQPLVPPAADPLQPPAPIIISPSTLPPAPLMPPIDSQVIDPMAPPPVPPPIPFEFGNTNSTQQ
jgi:hypothetical protein